MRGFINFMNNYGIFLADWVDDFVYLTMSVAKKLIVFFHYYSPTG